jgi:hypothetical protein
VSGPNGDPTADADGSGAESGDGRAARVVAEAASADRRRGDSPDRTTTTGAGDSHTDRTRLVSRIVVTWVELVVVGFAGTALGGAASGPPQLVVYLGTTLLSVGVLLFNVDRLVASRLTAPDGPGSA